MKVPVSVVVHRPVTLDWNSVNITSEKLAGSRGEKANGNLNNGTLLRQFMNHDYFTSES